MACTTPTPSSAVASPVVDVIGCDQRTRASGSLRRSNSASDVRRHRSQAMRRSRSEPLLLCSSKPSAARAATQESKLKGRSAGVSPLHFLLDWGPNKGTKLVDVADGSDEEAPPAPVLEDGKRSNWMERILELRRQWKGRQQTQAESAVQVSDEEEGDYCAAPYDSEEGDEVGRGGKVAEFDREAFSRLLAGVPWAEIKLFSRLAFLCNVAYVIPQLKAEDLRNFYDLRWVTSSLEKKSEAAAAAKAKRDADSAGPSTTHRPPAAAEVLGPSTEPSQERTDLPAATYGIAACAASYVYSRTTGAVSVDGGGDDVRKTSGALRGAGDGRVHECEMAAHAAASTMTAVVAAEEGAKLEAARDLRSLHSSPCEWFVCDETSTCTRCFVIQGSDSLASWQANLFFEPTKFEGTEALVHRGIYEAAKGIYEQFMPEILSHLGRHGGRARLRFTGHSLGGSLSLLVHLMLLARGVAAPSALLPVVTFGSPFVFCGGGRVLDELGLDEGQVCCVVMHRDIVPRAFSCSYPDYVSRVLKRLSRPFRSHPCLHRDKLLYSPLGKLYILQPDEKYSPPHPLLPPGCAIYSLDGGGGKAKVAIGVRAFLNTPHPLETLRHPAAYGSEGTILRDHESSNYLKAVNEVLRRHTKRVVRRLREQRLQHWWPPLTMTLSNNPWSCHEKMGLVEARVAAEEVATGV